MNHLNFNIKALTGGEPGTITGLAAVYGNVDRVDDVIIPGAFTKTLRENGGQPGNAEAAVPCCNTPSDRREAG